MEEQIVHKIHDLKVRKEVNYIEKNLAQKGKN